MTISLKRWQRLMDTTTALEDIYDVTGLDRRAISTIRTPARLVYGGRSGFLRSQRRLARLLPQADQVTVAGAGHFFPFFRPQAMQDAVAGVA